jgi:hypothetical protein
VCAGRVSAGLDRRGALQLVGGASLAALLAACGGGTAQPATPTAGSAASAAPSAATASPSAASVSPSAGSSPSASGSPGAARAPARLVGYAFNAGSQDVTRFDPGTRQPLDTRPLGATVRWLSNEQRFWDGQSIWTYDFPDNRVAAMAIDPATIQVTRTIATGGTGPAHSLVLTPDLRTAWVNLAGDDKLAALDIASGQVAAEVTTGAFP